MSRYLVPNKHNGDWESILGRSRYNGGGGGGTSTTYTSNVPEWLKPQTEALMGAATQNLFQVDPSGNIIGTRPYTPYSTNPQDYLAGFSPLQQQVQANAANLQVPGQFNQATGLAGMGGMGAMQSAQQAMGYGNAG